jgi:hypothetical protein
MHARPIVASCLALLAAAPLLAQSATADPITGTWKGQAGPNGGAATQITMELKFDGKSAVSGAVLGFPSPGEVRTGTFDPATNALKLIAGPTGDPSVQLTFEGYVVEGTATGRASRDGGSGTFLIIKSGRATAAPQGATGDVAAGAVRAGFGEVSGWVTKAAELIPANKYSYRPTTSVRTVGQMLGHIADSYGYYCSRATKRNVQWSDAIEKGVTDKATLAPRLKQAVDSCNAVYAAGTGDVGQLMANIAHTNLHYGNLITYIRMMGMTPPSS